MARFAWSLGAGLLFGLGLVISGMTNPAKVLNFLDVFGTFDPSLAFVLGGALVVTLIGYRIVLRHARPLLAPRFEVPTRTDLDPPLIGGAVVFGLGWGLAGFCPGPAVSALPQAADGTLIFAPAMLAGMWLARIATTAARQVRPV